MSYSVQLPPVAANIFNCLTHHRSINREHEQLFQNIALATAPFFANPIGSLFKAENFVLVRAEKGIIVCLRKHSTEFPRQFLDKGAYKRIFQAIYIQKGKKRKIQVQEVAIGKAITVFKMHYGDVIRSHARQLLELLIQQDHLKKLFLPPPRDESSAYLVSQQQHDGVMQSLLEEASYDALLPSEGNFLRLIDRVQYNNKVIFVYPLAEGNLFSFIRTMTPEQRISAAHNLLEAIAQLHAKGMRHGDIKPTNCLMFNQCSMLKLSDFGALGRFDQEVERDGTMEYLAPEGLLWLRKQLAPFYDKGGLDAWAVAMVLFLLFTEKAHPFDFSIYPAAIKAGRMEPKELQPILNQSFSLYEAVFDAYHKDLKKIIQGLLTIDVHHRLSVRTALRRFASLFIKN